MTAAERPTLVKRPAISSDLYAPQRSCSGGRTRFNTQDGGPRMSCGRVTASSGHQPHGAPTPGSRRWAARSWPAGGAPTRWRRTRRYHAYCHSRTLAGPTVGGGRRCSSWPACAWADGGRVTAPLPPPNGLGRWRDLLAYLLGSRYCRSDGYGRVTALVRTPKMDWILTPAT